MTREQWKEKLPLIRAFAEGKGIQIKLQKGWVDNNNPTFDDTIELYRIKPEPKMIPFTYEDDLVGRVVQAKNSRTKSLITEQGIDGIYCGDTFSSYNALFTDCQFLDGSPCGK